MPSRYTGKIKVISADRMCFPADPITLEPLGTEVYDAYTYSDPELGPVETISHSEWCRRRNEQRDAQMRVYYRRLKS